MDRLSILVGRFYKSVPPTKYFFKVQLVGRFIPLIGGIGRLVESPLQSRQLSMENPQWNDDGSLIDNNRK